VARPHSGGFRSATVAPRRTWRNRLFVRICRARDEPLPEIAGRRGGPPARALLVEPDNTVASVARLLGVSRSTAEPAVRTGALIGYGRVSTAGQNLDRQVRALRATGCVRIFTDTQSGKTAARPEYRKVGKHRRIKAESLIAYMREDDRSRRVAADELSSLSQEMGLL
jgi:hypothetical protein